MLRMISLYQIFLNLLLCLVILTVPVLFVGCGEDEVSGEGETSGEYEVPGQDLVGTWTVETIDGEPLFTEEEIVKAGIESYTFEGTFSDANEGKWSFNLSVKCKIDEHLFTVKATMRGSYAVSNSDITIVYKYLTVDFDIPQELIDKGFTEDDAKKIIVITKPEEEVLLKGTYTISGDTLTITGTYRDGETIVIVLKKKQ